jgi:hypothetical protein
MPVLGAARRALQLFAASVLVSAAAAAPAAAQQQVTISGPSDSRLCWVASAGPGGGCGIMISGWTYNQGYEYRGLLWFDLAGNVPSTSTVTSATLRFPKHVYTTACGLDMWGFEQTADWLSTTPTWNSPDGGTTLWDGGSITWNHHGAVAETNCDSTTSEWDVTSMVQAWQSGGHSNYGLTILKPDTPWGVYDIPASAANPPELVVDYTP